MVDPIQPGRPVSLHPAIPVALHVFAYVLHVGRAGGFQADVKAVGAVVAQCTCPKPGPPPRGGLHSGWPGPPGVAQSAGGCLHMQDAAEFFWDE